MTTFSWNLLWFAGGVSRRLTKRLNFVLKSFLFPSLRCECRPLEQCRRWELLIGSQRCDERRKSFLTTVHTLEMRVLAPAVALLLPTLIFTPLIKVSVVWPALNQSPASVWDDRGKYKASLTVMESCGGVY